MELVKGVPLTEYCDKNHLPAQDRLELFINVCHAIQHAHQKGIIHRDIKPSNIMVTLHDGKPVPKVIDFGVSKALSQQLTEKTLFTAYGQMIGTPAYMSPEQAELSGLDIDTRSDIYSLGVLLYELLTGSTPFDGKRLKSAGYAEMQRIIREEDPPKPSTRLTAMGEDTAVVSENRSTDPKKLGQFIRGDLDWIVMKALDKDRNRRYETANGFANDIGRFLNDEPVLACPPSVGYRYRKFARRNRTPLTTATVVALSLLVGTSVSIWQAIEANNSRKKTVEALGQSQANFREANRQKNEADHQRKLANRRFKDEQQARKETVTQRKRAESNLQLAMDALNAVYLQAVSRDRVFGETDPDAKKQLTDKEKQLLQTGLDFYTRIANQNDASTGAASATAAAFLQIALLRSNLDDPEGAETALSEAIARYKKLTESHSDNAHYFERLGFAYLRKGKLKQPLEFDKALAAFNEALAIDPDHWLAYAYRGDVYRRLQQYDEALADHLQALEFQPDRKYTLDLLFQTFNDLQQNDKAVAYLDQRIAADPINADFYIRRASVHTKSGQFDKALADCTKATELNQNDWQAWNARAWAYFHLRQWDKSVADYSKAIELNANVHTHWFHRGHAHLALRQWEKAIMDFAKAMEMEMDQNNWDEWVYIAQAHTGLGQWDKAIADYSKAIELQQQAVALPSAASNDRNEMAYVWTSFGGALRASGQSHDAERAYRKAFELWEQLSKEDPAKDWYRKQLGFFHNIFGDLLEASGKNEKAEQAYRRAIGLHDKLAAELPHSAEYRRRLAWSHLCMAQLLQPGGRKQESQQAYQRAIENYSKATGLDQSGFQPWYELSLVHLARGSTELYKKTCASMLEKFKGTEDLMTAQFVAWSCALAPDAVADFSVPIALAQKAAKGHSKDPFCQKTLGAILYRAGRFEEAVKRLTEADRLFEEPDFTPGSSPACTWFFLAKAHQRLGDSKEAKQWLGKAAGWTDEVLAKRASDEHMWNRRMTLRLLRKEAEELMDITADSPQGAKVNSQGRKPLEPESAPTKSPNGATEKQIQEIRDR